MFTPRRFVKWDDDAISGMNLMVAELDRELNKEEMPKNSPGRHGIPATEDFISGVFTVTGSMKKVAHGLGVAPQFVHVEYRDGNTGTVYLPHDPDATNVYLGITAGSRKIRIKAEV